MPKELLDFGLQLGQQVAGTGLGLLLQKGQDKRQIRQQQQLTDMQLAAMKDMGKFNLDRQMELWEKTNYPAQMEMLKQAGLNPGLLYGMGGAGGGTTAATAGSAGGGTAAGHSGEAIAMGQTAAQLGLMRAQKENIEASTQKLKAETTKTAGVDTQEAETRITDLLQGIENKKIEANIRKIDEIIKSTTKEDQIDQIQWLALKSIEELTQAQQDTFIKRATANDIVDEIKARAIGAVWQNALTQSNIAANYAEIQKWATELAQGWEKLDQNQQQIKINDYEAKLKEKYPGLWNVGGKFLNGATEAMVTILRKLAGKEPRKDRIYTEPKN